MIDFEGNAYQLLAPIIEDELRRKLDNEQAACLKRSFRDAYNFYQQNKHFINTKDSESLAEQAKLAKSVKDIKKYSNLLKDPLGVLITNNYVLFNNNSLPAFLKDNQQIASRYQSITDIFQMLIKYQEMTFDISEVFGSVHVDGRAKLQYMIVFFLAKGWHDIIGKTPGVTQKVGESEKCGRFVALVQGFIKLCNPEKEISGVAIRNYLRQINPILSEIQPTNI